MAPEVLNAMLPYFATHYGNPSSQHKVGMIALNAIKQARLTMASYLNIHPEELIFTSGGTESNYSAIFGIAKAYKRFGQHIITSPVEHKSVLAAIQQLKNEGFQIDFADVDKFGQVIPESVISKVNKNTILIAIMHANNELGTINPINMMAKQAKQINPKVIFFSDGVQAFGKLTPDLFEIDSYTISGHKIHGPKGIGALILKKSIKYKPHLIGGNQESEKRAGTENVPGIIGLAKATQLAFDHQFEDQSHGLSLKKYMLQLLKSIPDILINSPDDGLANTINFSIPGFSSEILTQALSDRSIYVSAGSACDSNSRRPSHVLQAIQLPKKVIDSAIRVSFSKYTTFNEITLTVNQLKSILNEIASIITLNK